MSEKKVFYRGCLAERNPAAAATWKLLRKMVWGQKRNILPIAGVPAGVLLVRQKKMSAVPGRAVVSAVSRFLAPAVKTAMLCWKARRRQSRQWDWI